MKSTSKKVATINNVEILIIENGEKRVAIKPICEALGIDYSSQLKRLKSDEFLNSVMVLSTTTGADGKQYKMQTIPFKYSFGWLFKIDSRNVKEEAKETILKYQMECYDALYNYFTSYADFVETKQKAIDEQLNKYDTAKKNFRDANSVLKATEKELKKIREYSFEDFDLERRQLKMNFVEETIENQ